jgi:hypothetical protein
LKMSREMESYEEEPSCPGAGAAIKERKRNM